MAAMLYQNSNIILRDKPGHSQVAYPVCNLTWVASRQNQQSNLCSQRRLGSAWASAILMGTHNICFYGGRGDSNEYPQYLFYGELLKTFLQLSSNTLHICSSEKVFSIRVLFGQHLCINFSTSRTTMVWQQETRPYISTVYRWTWKYTTYLPCWI